MLEKKLSIAELSQTLPARLMLHAIPFSLRGAWWASLEYLGKATLQYVSGFARGYWAMSAPSVAYRPAEAI